MVKEKEYFDEDGHSYYFKRLKDSLLLKRISDDKLKEYDENIKRDNEYVKKLVEKLSSLEYGEAKNVNKNFTQWKRRRN